ncbi:hypothetical protein FJZ18_02705 [Candidatus Pacearchaeota archaeon]|nr:hypothetical protein [Candidatus Pacearchaeota archaeon]
MKKESWFHLLIGAILIIFFIKNIPIIISLPQYYQSQMYAIFVIIVEIILAFIGVLFAILAFQEKYQSKYSRFSLIIALITAAIYLPLNLQYITIGNSHDTPILITLTVGAIIVGTLLLMSYFTTRNKENSP